MRLNFRYVFDYSSLKRSGRPPLAFELSHRSNGTSPGKSRIRMMSAGSLHVTVSNHIYWNSRTRGGIPAPTAAHSTEDSSPQVLTPINKYDYQSFDGPQFSSEDSYWKAGGVVLAGGGPRLCI